MVAVSAFDISLHRNAAARAQPSSTVVFRELGVTDLDGIILPCFELSRPPSVHDVQSIPLPSTKSVLSATSPSMESWRRMRSYVFLGISSVFSAAPHRLAFGNFPTALSTSHPRFQTPSPKKGLESSFRSSGALHQFFPISIVFCLPLHPEHP